MGRAEIHASHETPERWEMDAGGRKGSIPWERRAVVRTAALRNVHLSRHRPLVRLPPWDPQQKDRKDLSFQSKPESNPSTFPFEPKVVRGLEDANRPTCPFGSVRGHPWIEIFPDVSRSRAAKRDLWSVHDDDDDDDERRPTRARCLPTTFEGRERVLDEEGTCRTHDMPSTKKNARRASAPDAHVRVKHVLGPSNDGNYPGSPFGESASRELESAAAAKARYLDFGHVPRSGRRASVAPSFQAGKRVHVPGRGSVR